MAIDVFSILKSEHNMLKKGMRNALENGKGVNELMEQLRLHIFGEEKSVFPILQKDAGLKILVTNACEEHERIKGLMKDFSEQGIWSDERRGRLSKLLEIMEVHMQKEELIFSGAKLSLDQEVANSLSGDYIEAKNDLKM